jgi:hypothetical protein
MNIERFIDISYSKHNGMLIVNFVVNHALPTQLQMNFLLEDLKNCLDLLIKSNIHFGFHIDIRKIGLLSYEHIKLITYILEQNQELLEGHLYASAVITEGDIIKYIFEIVKLVYRTKKPLDFFKTSEEALKYIEQNRY